MFKSSKPQSLETYLAQIARELRDLPSQARADELREIEAHLRALVLASQQLEDLSADAATATALRQFGEPRNIGKKLRKSWQRQQPETWWRAVLAPIAGTMSLATSALVYNGILDYLGDLVNRDWTNPMYFCFSLFMLFMFFFAGFTAGVVSPKHGFLSTLIYFLYCAYEFLMFPSDFEDASVLYLLILIVIISPVAALAGTHFGARRSRKIWAIAGVGSDKFLDHITASRKFLARIAGDSKLNVQL